MSVTVFFSYSHKDEDLRNELATHLKPLERQGLITSWHDRSISAGTEWKNEIDLHLKTADIILLLVSSYFINSDYCWDVELELAMKRHDAGEARVIPIILRPVDWQYTVFGKLQALPRDARPVTSWPEPHDAFHDIAVKIRAAIIDWQKQCQQNLTKPQVEVSSQRKEPRTVPQRQPISQPVLEDDLSSEKGIDYKPLQAMLKAGKWRDAEWETFRVMCQAMGREKEGWLRIEDAQQFPCQDLRTIDALWVKYSDGKFGFSVQKKIWQECGSPTDYSDGWEAFGDHVGWKVNNNWIDYDDVTFSTTAPSGHLPFNVGFDCGSSLGSGGRVLSSLAQRLMNHNVNSPSVS